MAQQLEYGTPDPSTDIPALARIMAHAFAFGPEDFAPYFERTGPEHFRMLRDPSGVPVAMLVLIPMGQFFGGRSVPMTGIAAVGVAPELRGRGIATVLMRSAVRDVRASGVPLSGLYPATQPLYRRVGYEQAGHRFEYRIPIVRLQNGPRPGGELTVRAYRPADMEAVGACYRAVAADQDGHLDRSAYVWNRILVPRQGPSSGFMFEGPSGAEGYLFVRQERITSGVGSVGRHDVVISDWCAATERAAGQLLSFAAEFGSMGEEVLCFGGPALPLLMLAREQRCSVRLRDYWMLRIVDLPGVVGARGFACGLSAEAHLDVTDELLPENGGRWVVRVEGGRGRAERGGSGAIRLDVGALASWYSGFASPRVLRRLGRVHADDDTLRAAEGLFAGGTPAMPDMF